MLENQTSIIGISSDKSTMYSLCHVVETNQKLGGPKIELCGTPHIIDALSEYAFTMQIINFPFGRYDVYRLIVSSVKP